ncbi:hypothetical protein AMTRI_Chr06g172770 [Amborella trichopoda]
MAAYRQRERDALLLLQLQREVSIPLGEAMPKPRGFNGCCIAAIVSIATAEHREREVREEREGGPRRESIGERLRSVKRKNRREGLTLIVCQCPIKKRERAAKPS